MPPCTHVYSLLKGSHAPEESIESDSDEDSDSLSTELTLNESEEETVESVIASLPHSDLGTSAAQTQGFSMDQAFSA